MDESERARDEKSELVALADELLAQATEIRRQWSELATALGDEGLAIAPEPAGAPEAAPIAREPRPGAPSEPTEDLRRLVALDMLLTGRTREEVTDHLRETFGDEGIDELVASVFQEYSEG